MVDLGPLLVRGDVGKVSDHDDGLLLAVHRRLEVVGRLAVLIPVLSMYTEFRL